MRQRGPVAGVPGQYVENCSGHVLPRTPKWSGNVRYTHKFALENGADITGGLVVKYEADQVLGVNWSSPNFRQDAYELYDADLTYTAPSVRWNLQAYVRNIGNQAVYLAVSNATLAPATGPIRSSVAAIGSPRTFGVRLQANF